MNSRLSLILLVTGQTIMGDLKYGKDGWTTVENPLFLTPNGNNGIAFGDACSLSKGMFLHLNLGQVVYHYEPSDLVKAKYENAKTQVLSQRSNIKIVKP